MASTNPIPQSPRAPGAPGSHGGPPSGGQTAGGLFNAAIDPVRLLKQYWPYLAGAAVVGIVVGIGSHIALKRLAPLYTAQVMLKVNPSKEDAAQVGTIDLQEQEITRFMYTQVQEITSKRNYADTVRDPAVRNDTTWAKQFVKSSGTYDEVKAARRLEKRVAGARVVPDTFLIQITATTRKPTDAAAIASTVTKSFMTRFNAMSGVENTELLEVLTRQKSTLENEKTALERRMQRLLADSSIESIEYNLTESSQKIQNLGKIIAETQQMTEEAKSRLAQYDSLLTQPGGITYPDYLRGEVSKEPTMYVHDQNLAQLRSGLQSARTRFGPNHVEVRRLEAAVRAEEQTRAIDEQRLLAEKFNALIEFTRETIRGNEARIREAEEEMRVAMTRSGEMTRLIEEYTLLKQDAERKGEMMEEVNLKLGDRKALLDRQASRRVEVYQAATTPEFPSFPKPEVIVPAATVIIVGLVAGVILLREMLEQRVRTPADVAIMPRMKVLGVIPDLTEDPSKPATADTAVRERPHGAIAEQFRAIRSNILRNAGMTEGPRNRAYLVTSGLPGSGATMVVANMGRLISALDRKVLLIDGNLRRPRLHSVFGMQEGPGVAEILEGSASLVSAARAASDCPNLHVLPAGAKQSRVYERLNSDAMTALLDAARAEYDVVLVDSPPMTVSGDAIVLANRCEGCALVVRTYAEKRGLIARVRNQLVETKADFLGVIINGVKSSAGGYFRRNFQLSHEYHGGESGAVAATAGAAAA